MSNETDELAPKYAPRYTPKHQHQHIIPVETEELTASHLGVVILRKIIKVTKLRCICGSEVERT